MVSKSTEESLTKLKAFLQASITSGDLERLAAALISELLGVSIAVAKSGFQHGGDAGPAGRQGRRFRIETKRYADGTSLSDRELLGEIDHAIQLDSAIEAWFLVATREVPEQLEQNLLKKSDSLGLPIVVIDWKLDGFPSLAALCTSSPNIIERMVSKEAADLVRSLILEGYDSLELLKRDLESWNLGFEKLRALSHAQVTTIWNTPKTSMAVLGQDAAGGYHGGTIRRQRSFSALSAWWSNENKIDTPAAVVGYEGVGKTWAVLDWLIGQQANLPVILVVPSSAVAGLARTSLVLVKEFLGQCLYELTQVRDARHWQMRLDHMLKRPLVEGPVLTLLLDGMNQEPSVKWLDLIRTLQDTIFSGRIRLIVTTRNLHFTQNLSSLRGLSESPTVINVDIYDDSPGDELDQRLAVENLSRSDLHQDLVQLARTPRLFNLVIRFRKRLEDVRQVTLHRLLWEYGRDTLGVRSGKSFSEEEWREWLQEIASEHLKGTRDYSRKELTETTNRADLTQAEVFRRLSDIVDGQFVKDVAVGRLEPTAHIIAHALGMALLFDLKSSSSEVIHKKIAEWFDPINGLDQKPEILRAAVSILLEQDDMGPTALLSTLTWEWLHSQNLTNEHRTEIMSIATPLCDALLDVIQESNNASQKSAQLWASNALRSLSRTDLESYKKIINRTKQWLQTISRDVRPPSKRSEESEKHKERRFLTRIGFYENGNRTILGHQLTFVDDKNSSAVSKIPELLEGFPLVMAMPVFEIASLALAIRGQEAYWDGLKWICLLNDVDNDETVSALRKISEEMKCKIPEEGINPQLSLRVASLLLWLSGNEDDEKLAPILNPPIDNFYDYEEDYLASPSTSLYGLERRHVEMVLCDVSIPFIRKLDRTKKFFTDPNFLIPEQFRLEISQNFRGYDVSKLDNSRYMTSENLRFKTEEVILARCAPDLLAELARNKMKGFKDRSQDERYGTAIHATDQLLLADQDSADGARALQFIGNESNDSDEAFAQGQFLLLEIKSLPVVEKITTLIDADLKYIFDFLAIVIEPLNKDDLHILVEKYSARSKKQISDLMLLINGVVTEAYSDDWDWMASIAIDKEFDQQGSVFQLLHAIDLLKFGNFLLKHRWSWNPDNNSNSNHFGSLALIAATVGLPFEQYASLIAPWLLPRAVTIRGGLSEEVKIATSILDSIIMNQMLELPDLGADIKVSLEERKKYPSALSISMRNNESDDLFSELQKSGSEDDRRENTQKIFDEALNRIKQKKSQGAGLYLQSIAPQDLKILVEGSIDKIERWIEGLEKVTEDFRRRVSLAEGFYIALCEVLLTVSPDKGKALWQALIQTLITKFQGAANINEMLQIILRIRSQDELLLELYAIEALNTDKALFDLSIAAHLNGRTDWLDIILSQDLASNITWRKQRAEKLKGFAIGNVLPVSDAWPDGPIQNQPEQRKVNAAIWRHKEACAKYWWEKYWQSSSDEDAYAAWVLFLEVVDRRACVWMNIAQIKDDKTLPNIKSRLAHFYCNLTNLKYAMREQERKLDQEFLGRKTVGDIGPWREQKVFLIF